MSRHATRLRDADVGCPPSPARHRLQSGNRQNKKLLSDIAMGAFRCDMRYPEMVHWRAGGLVHGSHS